MIAPMMLDTKTAPNSTFKKDLLAAVYGDLQPAEMETLSYLIHEFEDVLSKGDYDLGYTYIVTH